jgi:hypothetical protein
VRAALPRWTIQLIGEPFDIEEYVANFPVESAFVFQRDGQTFLTGKAFEAFQDVRGVQEYAARRSLARSPDGPLLIGVG